MARCTVNFMRLYPALLLCCAAVPVLGGGNPVTSKAPVPPAAAAPSRSGFRFSAGAAQRTLGGFSWHARTQSSLADVPLAPGFRYQGTEAIGSPGDYADRSYRDGYVKVDAGTVAFGGDTWFWGYDDNAQHRNGSLFFQGGRGASATAGSSESFRSGSWSAEPDGVAPYLQLDWAMAASAELSVGWMGAVSLLNTDVSRTGSTFSASRDRTDYRIGYTDRYDLMGTIPPSAPYAGTLGGPGPLLPNRPADRAADYTVSGRDRVDAFNRITTDVSINLWTLSLGPTLSWSRDRFALTASAGLTLNVANWEATQRETLFLRPKGRSQQAHRRWDARGDGTEAIPGLFVQGSLGFRLSDAWDLSVFGRYDYAGDVEVSAGASTGRFDLSGWSVGGGLGYRF